MRAVKRPGSLYLSASAVYCCQALRTALSLLIGALLLGQGVHDLHGRLEGRVGVASAQHVVPALALLGSEDLGIALEELRHQAVHLGVVRDHDPVERPGEPGPEPARRDHFLAAGESEGLFLSQPTHRARVDGNGRVQVRVAPEDVRRVVAADVGRVLHLRVLPGHRVLARDLILTRRGHAHRHQPDGHDGSRRSPGHLPSSWLASARRSVGTMRARHVPLDLGPRCPWMPASLHGRQTQASSATVCAQPQPQTAASARNPLVQLPSDRRPT